MAVTLEQWAQRTSNVDERPELSLAMTEISSIAQRHVKAEAPVRTGFLRSQIHRRGNQLVRSLLSLAPYSTFVIEGTKFMDANPFPARGMRNAESETRRVREKLGRDMARKVARGS